MDHRQLAIALSVISIALPSQAATRDRTCPTQIEPLIQAMLPNLPAYANRIAVISAEANASKRPSEGRILSTSSRLRFQPPRSTVILAGRPEFEPLPIRSSFNQAPDPTLQQAFITTLERESVSGQPTNIQQFHWLFLTRTDIGWQLAFMFTRTGRNQNLATPPRESSQGTIGQAVQLWLRDCNARGVNLLNRR